MTNTIDRLQGISGSLGVKAPVRVATTAAITLSGLQTVDGVPLAEGDRVLVKNQASSTDNGLYYASSSSWWRTEDFDGSGDVVNGTLVTVVEGATGSAKTYLTSGANPITPGSSAITFSVALDFSSSLSGISALAEELLAITTEAGMRSKISAAKSGANSDITSLDACTTITGLTTPGQFTTGTQVPNTAWVRRELGNVRGIASVNSSTTLSASHAGTTIYLYGSTPAQTLTMPDAITGGVWPAGIRVHVVNQSTQGWYVHPNAGQTLHALGFLMSASNGAGVTSSSVSLLPGQDMILEWNGSTQWNEVHLRTGNDGGMHYKYDSGLIAVPALGAATTLTHGLGARPSLVQVWWQCVNAGDATAYANGDQLVAQYFGESGNVRGPSVQVANASEIVVRMGSTAVYLPKKDTGVGTAVTSLGNFNLIIRAWR